MGMGIFMCTRLVKWRYLEAPMTRLMTCHDYTARYDKATWSLEQLLDQGGYRLCAINVIFAQIGLAFAYTRTVANTLHQIWGLPMNWLFLGLGILLCLQRLGPESLSTRSETLCECWWMTFFHDIFRSRDAVIPHRSYHGIGKHWVFAACFSNGLRMLETARLNNTKQHVTIVAFELFLSGARLKRWKAWHGFPLWDYWRSCVLFCAFCGLALKRFKQVRFHWFVGGSASVVSLG